MQVTRRPAPVLILVLLAALTPWLVADRSADAPQLDPGRPVAELTPDRRPPATATVATSDSRTEVGADPELPPAEPGPPAPLPECDRSALVGRLLGADVRLDLLDARGDAASDPHDPCVVRRPEWRAARVSLRRRPGPAVLVIERFGRCSGRVALDRLEVPDGAPVSVPLMHRCAAKNDRPRQVVTDAGRFALNLLIAGDYTIYVHCEGAWYRHVDDVRIGEAGLHDLAVVPIACDPPADLRPALPTRATWSGRDGQEHRPLTGPRPDGDRR